MSNRRKIMISWPENMKKSRKRIQTRDLQFTSPILLTLNNDGIQPNHWYKQFNKTFESPFGM